MKVNYPEMIIKKSEGLNTSENYLIQKCQNTFLSLWSYPNVYKKDTTGQELCDVLAIYENNIFIFSDKYCLFDTSKDYEIAWKRWYKNAIRSAGKQIYGAERWIKQYPNRISLDAKGEIPFPLLIKVDEKTKFHRIIVAHGTREACKRYYQGGSGSLMIDTSICDDTLKTNENLTVDGKKISTAFHIGKVTDDKGFIHVFDDVTLDIIMDNLDTVSDFVNYLTKKEELIENNKAIISAGEEELLATYLSNFDDENNHTFNINSTGNILAFEEGLWEEYITSPKYKEKKTADKDSYFWDELLENNFEHLFNGTMEYMSNPDYSSQEKIFRFMASHNRLERRLLSQFLLEPLKNEYKENKIVRKIPPLKPTQPYYVFLILQYEEYMQSIEEYKELRRMILQDYMKMIKLENPKVNNIIGIAKCKQLHIDSSEDIIYLDTSNWTDFEYQEANQLKKSYIDNKLIGNQKVFHTKTAEFESKIQTHYLPNKGKNRNMKCPCGSGKKYKKCCGRFEQY